MKLRRAVPGDEGSVVLACQALAELGPDEGWIEAVQDGIIDAFILEAESGRTAVLLLSVSRIGRDETILWVVGAHSPTPSTQGEIKAALRAIRLLSQEMGCRGVSFTSRLPQWAKVAPRLGLQESPLKLYEVAT